MRAAARGSSAGAWSGDAVEPGRGSAGRREPVPSGITPSIARRFRGRGRRRVKATKWRPAAGPSEPVAGAAGSSERVVERVEIGALRDGRALRDDVPSGSVTSCGSRDEAGSSRCGRSPMVVEVRGDVADATARRQRPSASQPPVRHVETGTDVGRRDRGERTRGTSPRGPRTDARRAGACRAEDAPGPDREAERLEVRDPRGAHAGLLRRGETEEELRRVGNVARPGVPAASATPWSGSATPPKAPPTKPRRTLVTLTSRRAPRTASRAGGDRGERVAPKEDGQVDPRAPSPGVAGEADRVLERPHAPAGTPPVHAGRPECRQPVPPRSRGSTGRPTPP